MSNRIFADDWRDCLREQYKSVIRQQDTRTETTFTAVLYDVGYTQDELTALKFEATLRADDMPDDYVPEAVAQARPTAVNSCSGDRRITTAAATAAPRGPATAVL